MNLLVSGGNHEEAGTDNQTQETMNEQPQSESVHFFVHQLLEPFSHFQANRRSKQAGL